MDIQFVTSVYGAAKYICGYVTKPNKGMSDLMRASNNELKTQTENPSLAQLRSLGSMFVRANELSAQEASILLLKHPLVYSSRSVVFINTSLPQDRALLLKPNCQLDQLPDESTDVHFENFQIRYCERPDSLADICLAQWMSEFTMVYARKPNDDVLAHGDSDNETETCFGSMFQLKNKQKVRRIADPGHFKIIRYVNFSELSSPEKFYREQLMLFVPFRCKDESDILGPAVSYKEKYLSSLPQMKANREKFEFRHNDVDEALKEIPIEKDAALEQLSYSFAPNLRSIDDADVQTGTKNLTNDIDTEAVTVTLPEFETDDDYLQRVSMLNEKQQMFFLEVLFREAERLLEADDTILASNLFVSGCAGTGKSVLIRFDNFSFCFSLILV